MAILTGFPPSNTISPSVRITEKDLSFVPPIQLLNRAGLIGFASKGPINVPTLITTRRQMQTIFGFPHPESSDPYMMYAALSYLLVANQLYIVRVADEDAVSDERARTATVGVPSAGSLIQIESDTAGPYTFATDSFFRWRLNGILSAKTIVALAGTYTTAALATFLNDQLSEEFDGIEFYTAALDKIATRTVFAHGPDAEYELVSVQNAMYGGTVGPTNITGMGTLMTVGATVGANDRFPNNGYQVAGMYDFTGTTGQNINIVVDGTDNVNIDNIVQVIDLAAISALGDVALATIVSTINAQRLSEGGTLPGGWAAKAVGDQLSFETLTTGRDSRLLIKSDSTADTRFLFDNITAVGTSPIGTSGAASVHTYGRVQGAANNTGEITFVVNADTAGQDGNATQIVIVNNIREAKFNLEVYNNGGQVEAWGGLVKDESSRFYVETFLSLVSDWIRVADDTTVTGPPLDGTYSLSGGTDGIPIDPDDQDSLVIGNPLAFTGMYALSEPEQIDIDLIAAPGHSSTSVVTALLDLAQNVRQDTLVIVDPPFGLTVKEIVAWQNGTHPLNTTRFDSDFGALYWPWVKLRDNFNRIDVWAPPSGSVLATIARSDQLSAPWFAPAGVTRGIVPLITDVFSRPTLEERDLMYGNRNAINPIVQFVEIDGFLIWGQKTLQRRPTALDRVNVRRMLFFVEKRIRKASRVLLFEPHDAQLRGEFIRIATDILADVRTRRGIHEFIIQADEELNTPDVIDRNEMRARIGIQPVRAAEFIFIEFSIHRTGSFTENADTF